MLPIAAMTPPTLHFAGTPAPLAELLAGLHLPHPTLINTDPHPDSAAIIARCQHFTAGLPPATEALVITFLYAAPPGLAHLHAHTANAALWAFTRQAALEWAPRRIRVNAIGLGATPFGPFEPQEQSGRAAANIHATPATAEDVVRTVSAIAGWASMTGQIVRLGL